LTILRSTARIFSSGSRHLIEEVALLTRKIFGLLMVSVLVLALSSISCKKSDSSSSADGAASAATGATGVELEAQNAALAEIQKHYVKAADGMITARMSGSAYAPDYFLREVRDITVDEVHANDQTESDKLNGVEWSGEVSFKKLPCREAGDSGMVLDGLGDASPSRQHGQWSQWVQYLPEPIQLQKIKGQWKVVQDTWFLRGTIPTAQDFQHAGMKQ
jgi:hypothetical protein